MSISPDQVGRHAGPQAGRRGRAVRRLAALPAAGLLAPPVLLTAASGLTAPPSDLTWVDSPRHELEQARTCAVQQWLDAAANLADSEEGLSREQESDHSRRREAIEHVTSAVRRHVPSEGGTAYRVVVAHRFDWFSDKVAASLRELGLVVTSRLNDGAEALGAAIAEQPDLLVLQDVMVRLPSETVLTEVRRFAPRTVVAVQAEGADRARELRARGAHAPFARNLAPADVACYLADLLAAARFGGLDSEVARVHRG